MSWTVIVVLLLLGLIFLLLEILVFPGTSVAGIIGFALMAIAVWQTYAMYGSQAGHWVLAGTAVMSVTAVYFTLKSNTWEKASLKSEIRGRVNEIGEDMVKTGDKGKSVSRLAPLGKAVIGDEYWEVRSEGSFIDQGEPLIVTRIEDNKIYVKPFKDKE